MSPGLLLLSSYVVLALGLLERNGHFSPFALLLVCVSFCLLLLAGVRSLRQRSLPSANVPAMGMAFALLFLLYESVYRAPGLYLVTPLYGFLFSIACILIALATVMAYLLWPAHGRLKRWVFLFAVTIAFAFRITMPIASPHPVIDTFAILEEGARYLRAGQNPYTHPISDVYRGQWRYGTVPAYAYPPANLYLQTLMDLLTGDVRYLSVLSEWVFACILWWIARRRLSDEQAELLVLLFLFHPRSLFVLEQAWFESSILMVFSLFLLLYVRGYRRASPFVYGYLVSMKHYLVFFLLHWFLLERNRLRFLVVLATGLLTILPFFLFSPQAFVQNGILFAVRTAPFRPDSLNIAAFLHSITGVTPTSTLSIVAGGVSSLVTFRAFRRLQPLTGYLFAVTITTFALLLFGWQAFCDYYYFVGGLLLLLLAAHGGERTDHPHRA